MKRLILTSNEGNEKENHNKLPFHTPSLTQTSKSLTISRTAEDEGPSSSSAGRIVNGNTHSESNLVIPIKWNTCISYDLETPLVGVYPREA